jgi:hypothetical protein
MVRSMEARHETGQRFIRLADSPEAVEFDAAELLARLETQAGENGRLKAKVEALELAAGSERDARRRLTQMLKRERKAAQAIHDRAERERADHAVLREELERVRESAATVELHLQQAWARLADAERRIAEHERSFWRKLFRRPPLGA